jgi:hypothetical protein
VRRATGGGEDGSRRLHPSPRGRDHLGPAPRDPPALAQAKSRGCGAGSKLPFLGSQRWSVPFSTLISRPQCTRTSWMPQALPWRVRNWPKQRCGPKGRGGVARQTGWGSNCTLHVRLRALLERGLDLGKLAGGQLRSPTCPTRRPQRLGSGGVSSSMCNTQVVDVSELSVDQPHLAAAVRMSVAGL